MIAHKIIPAEDIPELVTIADKHGAVQAKATILNYQNTCFGPMEIAKAQEKAEVKALKLPTDTETLKKLWSTKKLPDGTLSLSKYKGQDEVAEIPAFIGKSKVAVIGEGAFKKNAVIRQVIIPDTVTQIEDSAFYNCKKLEQLRRNKYYSP